MGMLFTCSIDDGHPLDLKAAELLDKHGLTGTFYVPIKNREGSYVMSRESLRDLARRFEIGSHTYDHCYLRDLDVRKTYYQVSQGKSQLEDILGREVAGFCYPGGKYTHKDVKLVRACGFRYARTTVNLMLDTGHEPFEMPTTVQFYPHGREVYLRNFARAGHWAKRAPPLWFVLQHAGWLHRLHALFDYACTHGTVFHLWGHSKQIEEQHAWGDLDEFLGYVASRVGKDHRVTNRELAMRYFSSDSVGERVLR
jgi:peptidoglycan-N-acetylglucosamine deacetylase